MRWPRRAVALLAVMALWLGAVAPAMAVVRVPEQETWMMQRRLEGLRVVRPVADPVSWSAPVTRAQFVTVMVRAFGREGTVARYEGTVAFPDTGDHWGSGYIAVAKGLAAERGFALGLPDGSFHPDDSVTVAEVVAFLMKFLGVKPESGLPWPQNYLRGALNAGLITADDEAALRQQADAPATRGLAFYLADKAFYSYKLPEGGTVYTTYLDPVKPELHIDPLKAIPPGGTLTVTGSVSSDTVAVYVNGASVLLKDSRFTAEVKAELPILVVAEDMAGNRTEASIKGP